MRPAAEHVLIWVFLGALVASVMLGASQNLGEHDPVNPAYDLQQLLP